MTRFQLTQFALAVGVTAAGVAVAIVLAAGDVVAATDPRRWR